MPIFSASGPALLRANWLGVSPSEDAARMVARGSARNDRQRSRRRTALVLLLFQALLWMVGPSVEALVEARAADVVAHVETEGSPACPPIHSHLECQICRTLRSGAAATASMTLSWRTSEAPRVTATLRSGAPRAASTAPLGARAPPLA